MAVMGIIWQASALPSAPAPSGTPDWLLHAAAYMTLAVAAVRAFAGGRWAGVTVGALASAWLLAAAFGATDEWHQMYVAAVGAWSIIVADKRR
jgi:VanZ family protein